LGVRPRGRRFAISRASRLRAIRAARPSGVVRTALGPSAPLARGVTDVTGKLLNGALMTMKRPQKDEVNQR
jgi:hypothetical protein